MLQIKYLRRTKIGRYVYVKENKTKAYEKGHWKEKKKIEAVTTWLSTGSVAETSRMLEVPLKTLESWKSSEWWKDLVNKIRSEEDQQLDAKTSKIIDKALEQLVDRLENGEHVYDQKTGKIKRMPAKLRDVNTTFNSLMDKRSLLRNKPTKIVEQQSSALQLQNLADSFAKFVNKKIEELPDRHYIEGESVIQNEDGVYELKG